MLQVRYFRLASLLAALLTGCGAGARGSTVPRPEHGANGVSVHALLPPDTTELFYVDLASMRRAPFYPVVAESFDAWGASADRIASGGSEDGPEELAFSDVIGRADWVLLAKAADDDLSFVAAHLNEEQARALVGVETQVDDLPGVRLLRERTGVPSLARSEEAAPGAPERGEIASRPAWIAGPQAAAEIADGLWLVGPRHRVEEVLRRAQSASPVESRTAAMDRRVDLFRHHIAGTFADPASLRARFAGEEGQQPPAWLRSVRSAGFTLDLTDGVQADTLLTTSGANASWVIERELRTGLAAEQDSSFARLLGFSSLLRDVRVHAQGDEVRLSLALGARDAALHWGRISGAVGAALFVAESFTSAMSGLFDLGLDDLGGDTLDGWGDAGASEHGPRDFVVEVIAASSNAPATIGERCVVTITPLTEVECSAAVRCGERLIYGNENEGASVVECSFDEYDLFAFDDLAAHEDGSPRLLLNTPAGLFEMLDEVGPNDAWSLEAQIVE